MSQLSGKFRKISVMASHHDKRFRKNKEYKFLSIRRSKEESATSEIFIPIKDFVCKILKNDTVL